MFSANRHAWWSTHFQGQAEAVTEPKPSQLPDSVLTDLAPRIELSKYNITDELLQDLYVFVLRCCCWEYIGLTDNRPLYDDDLFQSPQHALSGEHAIEAHLTMMGTVLMLSCRVI